MPRLLSSLLPYLDSATDWAETIEALAQQQVGLLLSENSTGIHATSDLPWSGLSTSTV